MVRFGRPTPIFRVGDVKASIRYYTEVLGFTLNWCDEDGNSFASVSRGECNLFLSSGDQGHAGAWIWLAVGDADAAHAELVAKGAKIHHPPANYPWGSREVHVADPDGNVLRLGSENKPGEPFGDWRDMNGVLWKRLQEGGWKRSD